MSQTEQKTEVKIFVNRRELELHRHDLTGAQLLEAAGFEGDKWDLLRLHGEHDPTGGELVQAGESITLKNGERFRVIPGERTFGAR
jgi:Multiubiquitin